MGLGFSSMCGIAGFLSNDRQIVMNGMEVLLNMTRTLSHRGPDDNGAWSDKSNGIGLGHTRLSILDLSEKGHQPITSACGRYVMSFNGEIYNFRDIKITLEKKGHYFTGSSDTEVLLESISEWGLEGAIEQCNGMWAFALWDKKERTLSLCRDRIGKKPVYYGLTGDSFVFASELKAIKTFPGFSGRLDRKSITSYLRHNYVPSPYSIFEGIGKLPPASIITLSVQELSDACNIRKLNKPKQYWSIKAIVERHISHPCKDRFGETLNNLDNVLKHAVSRRMISDVPLGAFLSGGIDSSIVVAMMQQCSEIPVNTFSIGFKEEQYCEAKYAKEIAKYLGTRHTELVVQAKQALDVIPELPHIYDEPFSDVSQIPTYLLSRMTREHVTVALSGDGGDEMFAGYNRYVMGNNIWKTIGWAPEGARKIFASSCVRNTVNSKIGRNLLHVGSRFPGFNQINYATDRLDKLSEIISAPSKEDMYRRLVSHWKSPEEIVVGGEEPVTALTDVDSKISDLGLMESMMYFDAITYLPDDILTKVDRASMAASLEVRCPLLDREVIELSWKIPMSMKTKGSNGKYILKKLLAQYLPERLFDRPKMGFGVPIDSWLRGSLRDWAEDLLSAEKIKREGVFRSAPIRALWKEHLSGKRNWQYYIWDILMFQAWLDNHNK